MQRGKRVRSPLSLVVAAAQVTLVGVAMAQGSGGPQWSVPEVVARDLRMPWRLQAAVDSKGQVHVVATDDYDGDWSADGVRYWVGHDGIWRQCAEFVHDSLLEILELSAALDENDVFHLLWAGTLRRSPTFLPDHVFYSRCEGGSCSTPELLETVEVMDLQIVALPGDTVVACWTDRHSFDEWVVVLKHHAQGQWGRSFFAVEEFSPKTNGSSYSACLVLTPWGSLELAFFGEPWRGIWYPAILYASARERARWRAISEVYFNPDLCCDWPVVAITRDGYRHVFWSIDRECVIDIFPEQIYYSFSADAQHWSPARAFTSLESSEVGFDFPDKPVVAADSSGLLHVVWAYVSLPKEIVYYYQCGREHVWSRPVAIFSENGDNGQCALTIDRENRLHFVWVSLDQVKPELAIIRHTVAQLPTSAVEAELLRQGPQAALISAHAWPNPFNDRLALQLVPSRPCLVTVRLYDLAGRCVRILTERGPLEEGRALLWDGCDQQGVPLPSGVYLYRVVAEQGDGRQQPQLITGKVSLVR